MTGTVPFDQHGSLIRDPAVITDDDIQIIWRAPESFDALLRLAKTKTGHGYGRYVTWAEVHGIRKFPMAVEDLMPTIRHTILDHGVVEATWIPKERRGRRGPAYGIALVARTRFWEQSDDSEEDNPDEL